MPEHICQNLPTISNKTKKNKTKGKHEQKKYKYLLNFEMIKTVQRKSEIT